MNSLRRYKYHLIAVLSLLVLLLLSSRTRMNLVTHSAAELPRVRVGSQLEHALELLSEDGKSLSLATAGVVDLRPFILTTVEHALPQDNKQKAFVIARAIITEANHHKMDPLFLMAVIATESRFNTKARGSHGEIGLMQVLPKTALWLGSRAGFNGKINLENPVVNIRIGATYLARLRKAFHHQSRRYVAAYNMGSRNVRRLIASHVEPRLYPIQVMNNYTQIYSALNMSEGRTTLSGLASAQ